MIIIGIGYALSAFVYSNIGLILSIVGIVGFVIYSKLDKYMLISLTIWCVGIQFSISHWPGGLEIILIGGLCITASLFFLFKRDNFKNYKLWILISLIILFASYYIKLVEVDYNLYGFMIGALSLTISYGLRFVKKSPKNIEDFLKLILIYSILVKFIFSIGHYPAYNIISWTVILSILCLGGYAFINRLLMERN